MRELEGWLDSMLEAMRRSGVPVASALRPGLEPEQFAAVAAVLPFVLPAQVVALHRWRDGTDWRAVGNGNPEMAPYGAYLSLEEAVAVYEEEWGRAQRVAPLAPETAWDPRWLPLFERGNGDMVVVSCGAGSDHGAVIETRREEPDASIALHVDIREMVAFLTRAYASGAIAAVDVDGVRQVVGDRRALAAIRRGLRPPTEGQLREWVDGLGRSRRGFFLLCEFLPPEIVGDLRRIAVGGTPAARAEARVVLQALGG